jgi:hypothetical protein
LAAGVTRHPWRISKRGICGIPEEWTACRRTAGYACGQRAYGCKRLLGRNFARSRVAKLAGHTRQDGPIPLDRDGKYKK